MKIISKNYWQDMKKFFSNNFQ